MATLKTQGNIGYPDGAEPVAGGDNAFAAVALAVDPAWKALPLSTGWSPVAGGMRPPCLRVGRGRIELGGWAYFGGALPAAGNALTLANAAIADAVTVYAKGTNYLQTPLFFSNASGASNAAFGSLRFLPDGRLGVYPPGMASITNAVVCLEGNSIPSTCTVPA